MELETVERLGGDVRRRLRGMGEVHIIGGERKKALWKEKGHGD